LPIGSYVMETVEHRELCESRGSRTVLGEPGGETPPGHSTFASIGLLCRRVCSTPRKLPTCCAAEKTSVRARSRSYDLATATLAIRRSIKSAPQANGLVSTILSSMALICSAMYLE
jgi:hypothetical protein